MSKKSSILVFATVLVLGMSSMAFAGEGTVDVGSVHRDYAGDAGGGGFGIGVAALGTGIAMGNAINGALQGTARNPEAGGKIMTTMIIGLALIESLCIYALVICFILVGKIPALNEMFPYILKALGAE